MTHQTVSDTTKSNVDEVILTKLDDLHNKQENVIKDYEKSIKITTEKFDGFEKEFKERIGAIEESLANNSFSKEEPKGFFKGAVSQEFFAGFNKDIKSAKNYFDKEFEEKYTKDALGYQSNVWQEAGVLCPVEIRNTILDLVYNNPANGAILDKINWLSVMSKSVKIPVRTRPMAVTRRNEAQNTVYSKESFGEIEITPRRLSGAFRITWEQMNFTQVDVQKMAVMSVAQAMRDQVTWELFHGEKNDGLEGILRNTDVIEVPSEKSASFSYNDLFNMDASSLWAQNPYFIMHKKTFGWLRKQQDTIGQYYNAVDVTNMAVPKINGIPVILVTDLWVDQKLIDKLPYQVYNKNNFIDGFGEGTKSMLTSLLTPADLTAGSGKTPFVGGDTPILLADLGVAYQGINVDGMRMIYDDITLASYNQTQSFFHAYNGGAVVNPKAIVKLVISA